MSMVVNSNIAALTAQRNLSSSQNALGTTMERLSSGLRINSAKDDAAGLAISKGMEAQVRGMNQAVRNANDGISLMQTAEGALNENTNMLQRIRELAVQATNATNTASDRAAINKEVQNLVAEFDRVSSQTDFNGKKILDGTFSGKMQIGANVGQSIGINISDARASAVGSTSTFTNVSNQAATNQADFATRIRAQQAAGQANATINGVGIGNIDAGSTSLSRINAINAVSGETGVTAMSVGNGLVSTGNAADGAVVAGDIVINGVEIGAAANVGDLVAAINAKTAETGVFAAGADSAPLVLANADGSAITINVKSAAAATATGFAQGETSVGAGENGAIVLSTGFTGTFTVDDGTAAALGYTNAAGVEAAKATKALSTIDVSSVASAEAAIMAVDSALAQINDTRSNLGALQNRFLTTISNLESNSENLSAARGRIEDADFAKETSAMSKHQILQQAGTAMLAQANQSAQMVMQLLR